MRLIDADALYNGVMKQEYFDYVEHDNHGRESFAYSCAMQRLAEAPTISAIPVWWLREKIKEHTDEEGWQDKLATSIGLCIEEWQNEQEEEK